MQEKVNYGYHFVIMIDLLGQQTMYSTLESLLKSNDSSSDVFKEKLVEFIRAIENFKKSIDSFRDGNNRKEMPDYFPKEAEEFYKRSANDLTKIQRFSDGIMIYVPLMENSDAFPITSVMNALCCAGAVMLIQFTEGNPVRVGVGIGGAAEIDEGELFGPAIAYAHEMESKAAIYPRVAIHPNVVEFFDTFNELSQYSEIEAQYKYQMAKFCRSMIIKDIDGVFILDYLGETLWDRTFYGVDPELINKAFSYIKNQKDFYHKNKRIFKKYRYAYNYFLSSGKVNA